MGSTIRQVIAGITLGALCVLGVPGARVAAPAQAITDAPAAPADAPGPVAEGGLAGGDTVEFPLPVAEPITLAEVGAGNHASLGLADDGALFGWGSNAYGVLGDGSGLNATRPVRVHTPAHVSVVSVSVGTFTAYAVDAAGQGYSWGSGELGVLGAGAVAQRSTPGPIEMPAGVSFARVIAGEQNAYALDTEGRGWAWGAGISGQLRNDSYTYAQRTPVAVAMPDGTTFRTLSALGSHALAIGANGATYAWGSADSLLGNGTLTDQKSKPTRVSTPRGVNYVDVAAGWDFSIAVGDNGKLYAWGWNYLGALGTGTSQDSRVPVQLPTPDGVRFVEVVSGGKHSLARTEDGAIYAWGANTYGAIGNGTVSPQGQLSPALVSAPGVVFTSLAAGNGTSFATASDGTTYSWGLNDHTQLGDGTVVNSAVPTPVLQPETAVTAVTFGGVPSPTVTTDEAAGIVRAVTPAGAAYGAVDVALAWTFGRDPQPGVTLPAAFAYVDPPLVSEHPAAQSAALGEVAEFAVAFTGAPEPAIAWQESHDGGASWSGVGADANTATEAGRSTLHVPVTAERQGAQFRAVLENRLGAAESGAAALGIPEYAVTFDAGTGDPASEVRVLAGGTASAPDPAPSRAGARFLGWRIVGESAAYDFAQPVRGPLALEAMWETIVYTVTFDSRGGAPVGSERVDHGERLVLPATPTRAGYTFTGWFTDAALRERFDADAGITANLTLFAGWERASSPTEPGTEPGTDPGTEPGTGPGTPGTEPSTDPGTGPGTGGTGAGTGAGTALAVSGSGAGLGWGAAALGTALALLGGILALGRRRGVGSETESRSGTGC